MSTHHIPLKYRCLITKVDHMRPWTDHTFFRISFLYTTLEACDLMRDTHCLMQMAKTLIQQAGYWGDQIMHVKGERPRQRRQCEISSPNINKSIMHTVCSVVGWMEVGRIYMTDKLTMQLKWMGNLLPLNLCVFTLQLRSRPHFPAS